MDMNTLKWYQRIGFKSTLWAVLMGICLIGAIAGVMHTRGKARVLKESYKLEEQRGNHVVTELESRLQEIAALARTLAETAQSLPKDRELFMRLIPELVDFQGDMDVAGGGVWPEPYAFEPRVKRRSFFWGRNPAGALEFYDDYNQPGPGYHHEAWYVVGRYLEPGGTSWSRSYMDPYSRQPMVTVTVPTHEGGEFTGTVTIDLKLEGLADFAKAWGKRIQGYVFILDRNNRFITFPQAGKVRQVQTDDAGNQSERFLMAGEYAELNPAFAPIARAAEAINSEFLKKAGQVPAYDPGLAEHLAEASYQIEIDQARFIAAMMADPLKTQVQQSKRIRRFEIENDFLLKEAAMVSLFHVPGAYWKVGLVTPRSQAVQTATAIVQPLVLYTGLIILVLMAISYLVVRYRLIRPIQGLSRTAKSLAHGDLSAELSPLKMENEIGVLHQSFAEMMAYLREMAEAAGRISAGDLSHAVSPRSDQDHLGRAFSHMAGYLQQMMEEINGLIQAVAQGELQTRGQAESFTGVWKELVLGLNSLIDGLVRPIELTGDCIRRIGRGEIPEPLEDPSLARGDFNAIQTDLNRLIAATRDLTGLAEAIARGDLAIRARERSPDDRLMAALNTMVQQLQAVSDAIQGVIQAVEAGDLGFRAPTDAFSGGWGELLAGTNGVIEAFMNSFKLTAAYLEQIAGGSIPDAIEGEYSGDFNSLKQSLNRMLANLAGFVREVRQAGEKVSAGSQELSSSAQQLSEGSSQQAANIQEISSSMEEMSTTVGQNADNAKQTAAIARQTVQDTREGSQAVKQTVAAMDQISEKIGIIEEIARQTNMLALNAAIEAARAGEHGKGFAVVAAEVRKLAERSQGAARQINELSASSMEVSENALTLLENMVAGIQKTSDLIEEISAASDEQSEGIAQVNRAVQQFDQSVQQNAASTEQMASASREFSDQAERLLQAASVFRLSSPSEAPSQTPEGEEGPDSKTPRFEKY